MKWIGVETACWVSLLLTHYLFMYSAINYVYYFISELESRQLIMQCGGRIWASVLSILVL